MLTFFFQAVKGFLELLVLDFVLFRGAVFDTCIAQMLHNKNIWCEFSSSEI